MSDGSPQNGSASDEKIVQRNFGLTETQDEWLRERAFRRDIEGCSSKAELVRVALNAFMASHPAHA